MPLPPAEVEGVRLRWVGANRSEEGAFWDDIGCAMVGCRLAAGCCGGTSPSPLPFFNGIPASEMAAGDFCAEVFSDGNSTPSTEEDAPLFADPADGFSSFAMAFFDFEPNSRIRLIGSAADWEDSADGCSATSAATAIIGCCSFPLASMLEVQLTLLVVRFGGGGGGGGFSAKAGPEVQTTFPPMSSTWLCC